MALKPWYRVATPRQDLRQGKPLDAAQFAVHLDRVVAGEAPPQYREPESFFARTYLTDGLKRFAGEVLRRLSGEREGSNAVLNLVTGFGGGKTHALTLLYHLGRTGPTARELPGVRGLLDAAHLDQVPEAAVAVFVGTDWDAIAGRGSNGEPRRRTPWGDLTWQLAQHADDLSLFDAVAEQDEARVGPGKETIRKLLPKDRPVLILMDEVMNFMTSARAVSVGESTLASQFYRFVQALTEEADSRDGLCVVVSLPQSEQEMSAEDEEDFARLAKVTTRVAEPYVLAKDLEIPEIVRRRLFEDVGSEAEVREVSKAYARWVGDRREMLPQWFPFDAAEEVFQATYPFHPTVLSVFERKWQALPSFQRTRGILRLLAQWVSIAYSEAYRDAYQDPLITQGTAPLEDQFFRAAVLEQLGGEALHAAIIADIAGDQAHAERLDEDAPETQRRLRIHRKVASAIFFESSGGQVRDRATLPEVRLAVGQPDLDLGHVETALEALRDTCYYLAIEGGEYRFSAKPNLNRLLATRKAGIDPAEAEEQARAAIREVFDDKRGLEVALEVVSFPDEDRAIPDTPVLRLVVLGPEQDRDEARTFIEFSLRKHGESARRFANALVWVVPETTEALLREARTKLALDRLDSERGSLDLDEDQREQLAEHKTRSRHKLTEAVWQSYRRLIFLGVEGSPREEDLGLLHSSAAQSMQALIQARLRQWDELTDTLAPERVLQNWPKGLSEWSTRAVRDAVYGSSAFTRLLKPEALKETLARGVEKGLFGYAAKRDDEYVHIAFAEPLDSAEMEFSDDVVLVPQQQAQQLKQQAPSIEQPVPGPEEKPPQEPGKGLQTPAVPLFTGEKVAGIRWEGEIPPQKWTLFYTKVLSRLVSNGGLTLRVIFRAQPEHGILIERVDDTKQSLRELGLSEEIITEGQMDDF